MKAKFFLLMMLIMVTVLAAACGGDDDDNDSGDDDADDDTGDDDDDNDSGDDDADDDTGDDDADDDTSDDDTSDDDTSDDDSADDDTTGPYWEPSSVVPIDVYPTMRGYTVQRGIVHIHSVYSHDACDNLPFIGGEPNGPCLAQLRKAICDTNQQFVMLTDHSEPFSSYEFPDVLLYDETLGDELVYDDLSQPYANIITCDDGSKSVLTAGNENDLMPIHLHRMPDGDPIQRAQFLDGKDEATVLGMKDLGAQVLVNHAELWTTKELLALSIDGIELYNTHANLGTETAQIIITVLKALPFLFPYAGSGHCDLMLLSFLEENAADLDHFDKLLAARKTVGVMASDIHRNAIPILFWDGDRGDSYRRLMRWFSNYVLVTGQTAEDYADALARGRSYGAFQVFGEPVGFDFYAATDKASYEMGDEVAIADGPVLHVAMPEFYNMDPSLPEPEFSAEIIKAGADGGTVVATSSGDPIDYTVEEAGAYHVIVRVVPNHLRQWLGESPDDYIHEFPLIFSNAIYVTD